MYHQPLCFLCRLRPQRVAEKIAVVLALGETGSMHCRGPRWALGGVDLKIFFAGVPVSHITYFKKMVLFGKKQLGLSVCEVLSFSYLIIYPWQANCSGSFQQKFPRVRFHRDIHQTWWDVLPQTRCSKINSLVDQTSSRFRRIQLRPWRPHEQLQQWILIGPRNP